MCDTGITSRKAYFIELNHIRNEYDNKQLILNKNEHFNNNDYDYGSNIIIMKQINYFL